jgi:hypothetical protein
VIDARIIDGAVDGVGRLVVAIGSAGRFVQSGLTQQYLFVMLIGAIGLLVALLRGA